MTVPDFETRLAQALEVAGFTNDPSGIAVLGASEATPAGNDRIHRQTNDLILDLLQRDALGRCIHITGDARALVDPFHRDLCTLMQRKREQPFDVLYRLPSDRLDDPIGTVEWNLERWSSKGPLSWREKFLSVNAIGNRMVDMMASKYTDELQFSVFGNRYIQLQGRHTTEAKSKMIWLLDAPRLNEHLVERAEGLLRQAADVKESWFSAFTLKLNGVLSTYILRLVCGSDGIDRDGLLGDRNLDLMPDKPSDVLRVLKAMSLLTEDTGGRLAVTDAGRDFMTAV